MSIPKAKSHYQPRFEARKHTNLCTVQRRLRHLTSIIGRNINPNLVPSRRSGPKCHLLSLYFTIHAEHNERIILYKSETIENTLNPNWKEFDSNVFKQNPSYLRTSCVVIYVWGARKNSKFLPIIRYVVPFSGLQYCKEQFRSREQLYERNTLLFGMFGGYYTAPGQRAQIDHSERNVVLSEMIKVKGNNVHLSYKKSSLSRVHNSVKAINETREQIEKVKEEMEQVLLQNEHRKHKCAQREALMFRNRWLRSEWEKLKQRLFVEKQSALREKEDVLHRKEELNQRRDALEQYICEMKIIHSAHIGRRETLLNILAHLNFRRRQLAAELSYIYPIIELPLKDDNKIKDHSISGVQLPNSEDFVGKDETMLAVAIGNVAHLVHMMAKFMELPLRYPIKPMGSRSSVIDLVTDKLTDKQREFPLYLKGKEKFHFHYGVFLLNKNIAQLRYHNGLGTADLRKTLINLKHLLEVKYGVRIVVKKENIGFNKAVLMANREVSLSYAATPVGSHSVNVDFDALDGASDDYIQKDRAQSECSSGLPDVHVKSHHQHRFIARNTNTRKPKTKSDSLISFDEPAQPIDLLEVPFEDVVARTIGGDFSHKEIENEFLCVGECSKSDEPVDGGKDCLDDVLYHDCGCADKDEFSCGSRTCPHHDSNTLLPPDTKDREHDVNLSSSETVMV